uniref:uncharacterized protein LOC120339846 isoform X2 n=1 Tax=Styela clava TaxID=7725 RepID=UPI00193AB857|nr:uncharacterized protein LOC120339846 isoform X2 [Styela clava]
MESNKSSRFSSDPRSVPPKRISHYSNQPVPRRLSQNRDSRNELDSGKSKKKNAEDDDSDLEYYNFEKLKKFHIPRKGGQEEKELLCELSLSSREYIHTIYPSVRSSFFDTQAHRKLIISSLELVQNPRLEKEYLAKKKELKDEGRSEKDLGDSFGFIHRFKRSEVEKICKEGLLVGHCNLTSLGKPTMGVYVCKHADVVRFSKWEERQTGYIVMFKIIKGKMKCVTECRSPQTDQEPTPLYDCHITRLPIDVAQSVPTRAYSAFQYYFYEYGDVDVVKRPRQVLPYAVLKYNYNDSPSSNIPSIRTGRRESSTEDVILDVGASNSSITTISSSDSCFRHWRGKLLVKNGTFCAVEMKSHLDTVFNVANIGRSINIKACISLDKLKCQLPPTLMSKSAKKYNVIYRGRYYNTFTLHPTEEGSGLGKFRQLIGHLVQRSSAAYVPLRNSSSLYLLPLSALTEEMGLRSSSPDASTSSDKQKQSQRAWKNFLHVIVITPKALSTKMRDQRVNNVIQSRKRKEASSNLATSSIRDALEQELVSMNIDPSSALSSMDPEQHEKIYNQLKHKKKMQTSEKMLHGFYKDMDVIVQSAKSQWRKNLSTKWMDVKKSQQEIYSGKKKLKIIPPFPNMKRTRSKEPSPTRTYADNTVEDHTEATFSDDDDIEPSSPLTVKPPTTAFTSYKIPKKPRLEDPRVSSITNIPFDTDEISPIPDLRDIPTRPFHYTPSPTSASKQKPPTQEGKSSSSSILRPAFKPLEELIFTDNLEELMKHPEFSFSDGHWENHKATSDMSIYDANSPYVSWESNQQRISITFTHDIPYPIEVADCPFAFEMDPLILSMLRAIHGTYNRATDISQDEHEKVKWVRRVLHTRGSLSTNLSKTASITMEQADTARRIEHIEEKASPSFMEASPHQSSTDSGFVSSSATATPASIPVPDSPSLKDIAAILANAFTQSKTANVTHQVPETTRVSEKEDQNMEVAAKALLEVFAAKSTEKQEKVSNVGLPQETDDLEGVDMEIGSTPEHSPLRERERSRSREPSVTKIKQPGEQNLKSSLLRSGSRTTSNETTSSQSQDHVANGSGRSLLLHSLPTSQTSKTTMKMAKSTTLREETCLNILRKTIPGLPRESLQDLLTHIIPVVSKLMAKTRGVRKLNIGRDRGPQTMPPPSSKSGSTIHQPWASLSKMVNPVKSNSVAEMPKMTIHIKTGHGTVSRVPTAGILNQEKVIRDTSGVQNIQRLVGREKVTPTLMKGTGDMTLQMTVGQKKSGNDSSRVVTSQEKIGLEKNINMMRGIPGLDTVSGHLMNTGTVSTVNLGLKMNIQENPISNPSLQNQSKDRAMKGMNNDTPKTKSAILGIPDTQGYSESSHLGYSVSGQTMMKSGIPIKETTQSMQNPRFIRTRSAETSECSIGTIITQRESQYLSKEAAPFSEHLKATPIDTIITSREPQRRRSRGSDLGTLTQLSPVRGKGPYFKESQSGKIIPIPLRDPFLDSGHMVTPYSGRRYGQVGDNTGAGASAQTGTNTISEQNSELLSSILYFFNQNQDPRLVTASLRNMQDYDFCAKSSISPPTSVSAKSVTQVPMSASSSQYSGQIASILQQLVNPAAITSLVAVSENSKGNLNSEGNSALKEQLAITTSTTIEKFSSDSREKVTSSGVTNENVVYKAAAPSPLSSPSATLSLQDIQRIREKKERLKAQKRVEQELSRREAANMRDELNKSIAHKLKKPHSKTANSNSYKSKKPHSTKLKPSKRKRSASPESTTSSNSSEAASTGKTRVSEIMVKEHTKPLKPSFSLDQPASTQVLSDVAIALSDNKAVISSASSMRPTGVVTPTPRPVHPVFMQSKNSFPLTEVTSSPRNTTTSFAESEVAAPNPIQVLSEIDNTLSQLKQGMQSNGNENEMKDRMAKLLQLVLMLGGAAETDAEPSISGTIEQPTSSQANEVSSRSSNSNDTSISPDQQHLGNVIEAQPLFEPGSSFLHEVNQGPSTSQHPTVSEAVDYHSAGFRWTLHHFEDSQLNYSNSVRVLDEPAVADHQIVAGITREHDNVIRDYIKQSESLSLPRQEQESIDEILAKLRPFIQKLNKTNMLSKEPTAEMSCDNSENLIKLGDNNEPITMTDHSARMPILPAEYVANASPTNNHLRQAPVIAESVVPMQMTQVHHQNLVQPEPTLPTVACPIANPLDQHTSSQNSEVRPSKLNIGSTSDVSQHTAVIPPHTENLSLHHGPQITSTMAQQMSSQSDAVHQQKPDHLSLAHHSMSLQVQSGHDNPPLSNQHRFSMTSPSSRSDSGTPTMDERYPDPVRQQRRRKRRGDPSPSNSFLVFDPENSAECEAIRAYLASVKGIQFDVKKMSEKWHSNINKQVLEGKAESVAIQEEIRKVLPPGTIWVVFRTADLKHLHLLKHLSLLKSAGSHVQFVSADSVRDVRARQYKNILTGDGGILVPLCPKTLLRKPVTFRHLMLWLIGQTSGISKNKSKWRMVLHQHLLDALQDAEESGDMIERQNADQVVDLLCHASQDTTKLAVELVEHHCDKIPCVDEKTPSVWNWYDTASNEELSTLALPCATKLQLDRIRQSRHVVLLIDDDPLAQCWKPLWQLGICVSTMEKFVDLVCSKPSGAVTDQSLSCVLPLYGLAHEFL